jgi:mono/diheme cytochrome c family protein
MVITDSGRRGRVPGRIFVALALLATLAILFPASPIVASPTATAAATHRPRFTAFVFLSVHCPIANGYSARIAALAGRYAPAGVRFVGVYDDAVATAEDAVRHARSHGLSFPVLFDADGSRARRWGAAVTPEAVVVDRAGTVRYRGRIDDSGDPSLVASHDLRDALTALLEGRPVPHPETRAFGCAIQAVAATVAPDAAVANGAGRASTTVTYADDVAAILDRRCVSCHRAGQIGPMPFTSYRQAAAWAAQIQLVTSARRMPPWKADSHGEFVGDERLTDSEVAALTAWANGGAPEGNPAHTPAPPSFPAGEWPLGQPDVVFSIPAPYSVPADGRDVYRCFVIPTHYATDMWVSGIAFEPGNRAVVHHATVFMDASGAARRLDAADPGPGYTNPTPGNGPGFPCPLGALGGWTPGYSSWLLPAGVAERLPRGADLVIEVHYHSDGQPETDRTRFGLYFATGPIDKRLRMGDVSNATFCIPPGSADYVATADAVLPWSITVLSVTPHMHNLGRSMAVTATLPDGATLPIVRVGNWDFNWQPSYRYRTPVQLPAGTHIHLEAHFDNTASNPNNPNRAHLREVRWGESTTDEMCTCFFAYTRDDEHLGVAPDDRGGAGGIAAIVRPTQGVTEPCPR